MEDKARCTETLTPHFSYVFRKSDAEAYPRGLHNKYPLRTWKDLINSPEAFKCCFGEILSTDPPIVSGVQKSFSDEQKTAPPLGKPVLVMRDTTERLEGIKAGTPELVGTDEDTLYKEFRLLLNDAAEYGRISESGNPYGDCYACKRIVDILIA